MALFGVLYTMGLIVSCSINDTLCCVMSRGFDRELLLNNTFCCVMSHGIDSELFYK